jgi:hypothetical protein
MKIWAVPLTIEIGGPLLWKRQKERINDGTVLVLWRKKKGPLLSITAFRSAGPSF